jgi:hypothetical protein
MVWKVRLNFFIEILTLLPADVVYITNILQSGLFYFMSKKELKRQGPNKVTGEKFSAQWEISTFFCKKSTFDREFRFW